MKSQPRKKSPSAPKPTIGMMPAVWAMLAISLMASPLARAAVAGQITHLSGTLSAKKLDGTSKLLAVKSEVAEGDMLTTEADTFARVKFADGGEVVLRPGTQLKIESYAYNAVKPEGDSILLNLFKGGLRAVTGLIGKRSREKIKFTTETATIGIRGTHFGALLCQNDCSDVPTTRGMPPPNGLHVDVTSGAISMSNPAGTVEVGVGQFAYVPDRNTAPAIVPPQDGIQVTMPNSIARNKGSGRGVGKKDDTECAM